MKKLDKDAEILCGILRDFRIEAGYTQKKIAEYLQIDRTTYAKYENGRKPEVDVFVYLANLYNVSVTEMLGDYFPEARGVKRNTLASAPKQYEDKLVRLSPDEQRLIEYYRNADAKSSIVDFARRLQIEEITKDNKEEKK